MSPGPRMDRRPCRSRPRRGGEPRPTARRRGGRDRALPPGRNGRAERLRRAPEPAWPRSVAPPADPRSSCVPAGKVVAEECVELRIGDDAVEAVEAALLG